MARFCPNCGYEVESDSDFCDTCGMELNTQYSFNRNFKSKSSNKTVTKSKYPLNYDYYRQSPPKFTRNLVLGIVLSVSLFLTGVLIFPLLLSQDFSNHNLYSPEPTIIGEKYYEITDLALLNIILNIEIPQGTVSIEITDSYYPFYSFIEVIGLPHQSADDASNFLETRDGNTSYLEFISSDAFEYNIEILISQLSNISIYSFLDKGDFVLSAYDTTFTALNVTTNQGDININIYDSYIASSDYFSCSNLCALSGNIQMNHQNLTYGSHDFAWDLVNYAGITYFSIYQTFLTLDTIINYNIDSTSGNIIFRSFIQNEIGVSIYAEAYEDIFVNHSQYGFFNSSPFFTFTSENYLNSLMKMNFAFISLFGSIDCLDIDFEK